MVKEKFDIGDTVKATLVTPTKTILLQGIIREIRKEKFEGTKQYFYLVFTKEFSIWIEEEKLELIEKVEER